MNTDKSNHLFKIIEPLLYWYEHHARILPWRENPTPYKIWVSEIMLQQTRVEAVKPYYERFLYELPNIKALSEIEEDALLKLWEGLGYYNRVRNMQKAALLIMEQYEGQMPSDYNQLLKLPGIGTYTAGAIASIAYNICVPAVDGNVLRVISRLLAHDGDILKQSVKKQYGEWLIRILPRKCPGDFNQALMELGATVCVPNGEPSCNLCPLLHICKAKEQGIVMTLPKKTPKKSRRIEERTVLVIQDGEHIALCKRKQKGLLAGLYEFPNFDKYLSEQEVLLWVKEQGFASLQIQPLPSAKHIFSHIEWRMKGYAVRVRSLYDREDKNILFVNITDTKTKYPIPSAFSAYSSILTSES